MWLVGIAVTQEIDADYLTTHVLEQGDPSRLHPFASERGSEAMNENDGIGHAA